MSLPVYKEAHLLTIRRYDERDREAVWLLHNIALQRVGVHLGNGPWDDDLKQIREVYLDQGGEFLIGQYQNKLVAMGALRKTSEDRAEVKRMRVHPDYQGKGFGQAIYDQLENRARDLGYTTLHLDTSIKQQPAQKLYLKNGFSEVRRGMIQTLEVIFYEKKLAPFLMTGKP